MRCAATLARGAKIADSTPHTILLNIPGFPFDVLAPHRPAEAVGRRLDSPSRSTGERLDNGR